MLSDKRNSIMAKAMGLTFLLLDVASSLDVPFEALLFIKCTLRGFIQCPPLCPIHLCSPQKVSFDCAVRR